MKFGVKMNFTAQLIDQFFYRGQSDACTMNKIDRTLLYLSDLCDRIIQRSKCRVD